MKCGLFQKRRYVVIALAIFIRPAKVQFLMGPMIPPPPPFALAGPVQMAILPVQMPNPTTTTTTTTSTTTEKAQDNNNNNCNKMVGIPMQVGLPYGPPIILPIPPFLQIPKESTSKSQSRSAENCDRKMHKSSTKKHKCTETSSSSSGEDSSSSSSSGSDWINDYDKKPQPRSGQKRRPRAFSKSVPRRHRNYRKLHKLSRKKLHMNRKTFEGDSLENAKPILAFLNKKGEVKMKQKLTEDDARHLMHESEKTDRQFDAAPIAKEVQSYKNRHTSQRVHYRAETTQTTQTTPTRPSDLILSQIRENLRELSKGVRRLNKRHATFKGSPIVEEHDREISFKTPIEETISNL